MLTIDGAIGGGSVLRVSTPLALSKREPIKVINIRKSRSRPGLRLQHLLGLQALSQVSGYSLENASIGSTEVVLRPHDSPQKAHLDLKIDTAASVSLIVQVLSNYIAATKTTMSFSFDGGGTHTKWAPNFDYLEHVTAPILRLFGQSIKIDLDQIGYYPKGGAKGRIILRQSNQPKVNLAFDEGRELMIISRASDQLAKSQVAERQAEVLPFANAKRLITYDETSSIGSSITAIWAGESTAIGLSSLGEKGLPAEKVSRNIIHEYERNSGFPVAVDNYLADQLLVSLAYAPKGSSYTFKTVTDHVKVNLDLINQLLGNILEVEKEKDHFLVRKV